MGKQIGNYHLIQDIGRGSFSTVYYARNEKNEKYAIKMIEIDNEDQNQTIQKEIEILRQLDHDNIIKLQDIKKTDNNWYLIFEYCQYGDLGKFLRSYQNGLPEILVQKIARQLMQAMKELRKLNIVHRDLKLGNILLVEDFNIKLADFGFAKFFSGNDIVLNSFCGTPITMAPEIVKKQYYNEKCDIWSIGIILYQLLFGRPPFMPNAKDKAMPEALMEVANKIQKMDFNSLKLKSNNAKDLLKKCLILDPKNRIEFEELFEHPWLSEYTESSEKEIKDIFQEKFCKQIKKFKKEASIIRDDKNSVSEDKEIESQNSLQDSSDEDDEKPQIIKNYVQQLSPESLLLQVAKKIHYIQIENIITPFIYEIQSFVKSVKQVLESEKKNISDPDICIFYLYSLQQKIIQLQKTDLSVHLENIYMFDLPFSQCSKQLMMAEIKKIQQMIQKFQGNSQHGVDMGKLSIRDGLKKMLMEKMNIVLSEEYIDNIGDNEFFNDCEYLKQVCMVVQQGNFSVNYEILLKNFRNEEFIKDKFLQVLKEERVREKYFEIDKDIQQQQNQSQLNQGEPFEIIKMDYLQKSKMKSKVGNDTQDIDLLFKILNDRIEQRTFM